jgi:hypothetical protein
MFHTIYLSFEEDGRDYIGKHTTNNPYDDYLGSFKDDTFDPTNKIILEYAATEEGAIEAEIRWQKVFSVVANPQFANKAYQTKSSFIIPTRGERHHNYGRKRPGLGEITKHNLNPAAGGRAAGKLPWWTDGTNNTRCTGCPGEGWELGRTWVSPRRKAITVVNLRSGEKLEFGSIVDAANALGIRHQGISKVLAGKTKAYRGYSIVYAG